MIFVTRLLTLSFLLVSALALSGCGEGWQAIYTQDVFPYGNQRTAGTGVVYVRENLMPAKTLMVEEFTETTPSVDMDMHHKFNEMQRKGKPL